MDAASPRPAPPRLSPPLRRRRSAHFTALTDDELAEAWQQGVPGAQEEAFRRFAPRLVQFAERRLRSRADASDVVQDTFVRASLRIGQLRQPAFLRAWLYAITRNRIHDVNMRREVPVEVHEDMAGDRNAAEVEDGIVYSAQVELVRRAATLLNDRDQQLVELSIWRGLAGADVSALLSIDQAHAYVVLGRARARLAKMIEVVSLLDGDRGGCLQLGDAAGPLLTRISAQRVARHLDACSTCAARRERSRGDREALLTARVG